jgi:isopentenyl-diphosphate delta-isomerase
MSPENIISSRKASHIRINLDEDVQSGLTTGLEHYHFIHQPLPELDLDEVDLGVEIFGKRLNAPILISSMTGGTDEAARINRNLAKAAQQMGAAMGVGSQRAALDHPELADSFRVRDAGPDILLFANIGAVNLNYGYGVEECLRAVEMIGADALILHFNALQEAVQPEGQTRFAGLLDRVRTVCQELPVPVIAKEVGWGFSERAAFDLAQAGVAAIDVAGAGGTSWSQVEMHRAESESQKRLAAAFLDWGIPTAQAVQNVRSAAPSLLVFASGGVRTGVEIAKCIALGASLGGMAGPFLKAAVQSDQLVSQAIREVRREIQVAMFAAGAGSIAELHETPLKYTGPDSNRR